MTDSLFGLDRAMVDALVWQVAPWAVAPPVGTAAPPAGGEEAAPRVPSTAELFARAALTGVAEPGDRAAGALVTALGAPAVLDALLERWPAERIVATAKRPTGDSGTGLDREDTVKALERWQPRVGIDAAVLALRQASRVGARLLVPGGPIWLGGLDDLGEHAPLALWFRGQGEVLQALGRSIALVGARAATGYGEHVAMEASAGLVDRGFAIVSGAAYGIDGMAHRAALASGGATIAFLAGGVDRFYPSGHDSLLSRMVEAGAVISELPCGSAPTKWRFLQRNRLIAAASSATVVLEAGWRSGSLNTAGHAASLGRPLGAVPGPVTSPASAGCHRLIRDYDAVCVTNADEMAELVPGTPAAAPVWERESTRPATTGDDGRVLDGMSTRSPRTALDIARRSGLSVFAVQSCLGRLELDGVVAERPTGWVRTRL
jgi:DNA processing protein